ncbi:PPK2 family polyphosphate kinase [Roseibacillus ishigakijimensis]|uniref:Polyphosphate kinase 2 family protein n=1 Tax=Roseibacillus ishigakijimensis TaxID=454146 RepID=A0A934RRF4_9BACT|nr:PPK2 family polyphosphate kinase [Roseibacillus ishigakijimensis]MBK1834266.1 polyphosphate kinase 2 family protein [Roseibacillus ishigakijimensis]
MPASGAEERYRHKPGTKLRLAELDPHEKTLAEDLNKEDSWGPFDQLRDELQQLQKKLYAQDKHRVLVVMQAMDTGGKDGCIKHVFSRVDPQGLNVVSFKKPSEEELAHDFLWRVHEHVPRNGHLTVFNRSHYEDIIAVRVKELYPDPVWKRRYRHVIDFERMLAEEGTTIVKIFLHISKEEQRERLQSRLDNPDKYWKFNPDDLKDRARWEDFMHAYEDVIEKTSTKEAPWYVVPADRKWYRNLCVARIMVDTLKKLEMSFPEPTWKPGEISLGE